MISKVSKMLSFRIIYLSLLLPLIVWAVGVTCLYLKVEAKVIFIDNKASYIVTDKMDRAYEIAQVNALKVFFDNYHSFEKTSFKKRYNDATDLYAKDLWEKRKQWETKRKNDIKKYSASQEYEILRLHLKENQFETKIQVKTIVGGHAKSTTYLYSGEIDKGGSKSAINPFGYEIKRLSRVVYEKDNNDTGLNM